jgi:hypothetical protein
VETPKIFRITVNVIYAAGVLIVLYLIGVFVFEPGILPYDPYAMIPLTERQIMVFILAAGVFPMAVACLMVYIANGIRDSRRRNRNLLLISLPLFVCAVCLFDIAVAFALGLVGAPYAWENAPMIVLKTALTILRAVL